MMSTVSSIRKVTVIMAVVMAMLCGCGQGEERGAAGPLDMPVEDGGETGQSDLEEPQSSAPARERVAWGAHAPVYEDGKEVLTYGLISGGWNDMEELIAAYNQQSEAYTVQIIDYYDEEKGYDDSLTAMQLDIVRGQAPDILSLSGIDYYTWAEKGILEDLYSYMDGDEELGRDAFVSSVLEANAVEGKLYAIGTHFNLMTLCGKTSIVGEKTGYSVTEMLEMLKGCGRDQSAILGFGADEPLLKTLCTFSMNDFVDWDGGTCDFTSDYFKDILEFCKSYQSPELSGTMYQAVHQDEVLLLLQMFNRVGDYQLVTELFGEPVTCVGFPVAGGGSGTLANMLGSYGINSAAANKEACWDFLKYMLENYKGYGGFPLLQRRFDEDMREAMEDDSETEPVAKAVYNDRTNSLVVYAATQEQVDAFKALVASADRPYQYHTAIMDIIQEEADNYFNGRKSLDDTVAVIQSRVGILVAE